MTNTGLQKHRRSLLIASAAAAAGWLTGCASTRASTPREALTWTGRLGLVVESEPPQSFAGGFELTGSATTGALSLFSPLGSQVARMQWSPSEVTLADGQTVRQFTSLAALLFFAVVALLLNPVPGKIMGAVAIVLPFAAGLLFWWSLNGFGETLVGL